MRTSDLAKIDLNLLVVLRVLIDTRSVTTAAERLGMSQPAVSRALAKLRRLFDDRLMVKGARGMMPTARAASIAEPLTRFLASAEDLLVKPLFDPAFSDRVFRIATTDYGALAVLPHAVSRFAREAPHAAIAVVPFAPDVFRALADGQVDVLLYSDNPVPGSFRTRELFREHFVSLVRQGHPLLSEGSRRGDTLPLTAFVEWPHVLVTVFGGTTGPVDTALAARGLQRRIAMWVPYFATAAAITASSDLIVTMPSRAAQQLAPQLGLIELNVESLLSPYSYRLLWHERTHGDLAAAWFRRLVIGSV